MNASEDPRKCTEIHGANRTMQLAPNASMTMKSPVRPRNSPSSRRRQYLHKKYMWNRKSNENIPKNKKFVASRHTWPSW